MNLSGLSLSLRNCKTKSEAMERIDTFLTLLIEANLRKFEASMERAVESGELRPDSALAAIDEATAEANRGRISMLHQIADMLNDPARH
jgi:predicted transcriptional regulator